MNTITVVLERNKLGIAYFEYRLIDLDRSVILAQCEAMSGSQVRAERWGQLMLNKITKANRSEPKAS